MLPVYVTDNKHLLVVSGVCEQERASTNHCIILKMRFSYLSKNKHAAPTLYVQSELYKVVLKMV
jgi:hypothetical protein